MKYFSVCSGIEAATVAWHHLGWKPTAFAEVEPFPSAVLAHHYPTVRNRGDMTKYQEWPDESVDLMVGGTPCQSFSVAGLRQGLADPRGNLMLTYLRVVESRRPKWVVWENVPGVLSSNGGKDFSTFITSLGNMGYGWAYRVLDAQWFGLAQRRKRVFVVGCLGDTTSASKVLFESESVSRNPAPSREAGKKVAATLTGGFGERGVDSDQIANGNYAIGTDCYKGAVNGTPVEPVGYSFDSLSSNSMKSKNPVSGCNQVEVSKALDTSRGLDPSCNQGGMAVTHIVHGTQDPCVSDIAFAQSRNNGGENVLIKNMAVRRLTPIECERLQGFSDNYTQIPFRNKLAENCPDGPRYKALGNSMAVPVMRWIGERINKVSKESA